MKQRKPVGRAASAAKYDLLTALGTHACQGDKHRQRLVLRLITLIVARYNWQTDEIAVGQREMARLWAVDERTVKRDVARLRSLGWLVQRHAAVRGRVAVHGLDIAAILRATQDDWPAVGPDFVSRMTPEAAAEPAGNVVPFRPAGAAPDAEPGDTLWGRAQRRLMAENPALFTAWFRPLVEAGQADGVFDLLAPTRFHAVFVTTHHLAQVLAAVQAQDATIRSVTVRAGQAFGG
ncbi:hypothetical protein RNZ50_00755 [Paracoccaceae bacterium Fryx2]|nr:hypothetical protein [Paracoccaceae bacterium Fryx2]